MGSDEHRRLMARMMLDTHDPYRPALIHWPKLDEATRQRIVSLPIWDIAVQTEGRAGMNMGTYAEFVKDPVLHEALSMPAAERARRAGLLRAAASALPPQQWFADQQDALVRLGRC